MSAPCSMGRSRAGVVKVESTISGKPRAWAASAILSISAISSAGFETVSVKKARVLLSAAAVKFAGSEESTKRTSIPSCGKNIGELSVGAAVEVAGGDDVVASLGEVDDRVENGGSAGGVG